MPSGNAMKLRVEVDERVMTKNGNFWELEEGGKGQCALKDETEVAGVDCPSSSSSESTVEDMVSVRSKARLLIFFVR